MFALNPNIHRLVRSENGDRDDEKGEWLIMQSGTDDNAFFATPTKELAIFNVQNKEIVPSASLSNQQEEPRLRWIF